MFKKDLIERDIEKFGEMIAKLAGIQIDGGNTLFENELENAIQDCVGKPVEELLAINDEDLLAGLLADKSFSVDKIDYLTELLYLYAERLQLNGHESLAANAYQKMQLLWHYATQHQSTISFDRISKNEKRKQAFKA